MGNKHLKFSQNNRWQIAGPREGCVCRTANHWQSLVFYQSTSSNSAWCVHIGGGTLRVDKCLHRQAHRTSRDFWLWGKFGRGATCAPMGLQPGRRAPGHDDLLWEDHTLLVIARKHLRYCSLMLCIVITVSSTPSVNTFIWCKRCHKLHVMG